MAIIAGTGHRPNRQSMNHEYSMHGPVSTYIKSQIRRFLEEEKPTQIISGMAIGYDQILAITSLEMNIPVIAAVPFRGQESKWPERSQNLYRQILADPNVTVREISEPGYSVDKMFIRDHYMVDNADTILACWDKLAYGGTYKTIQYAKSLKKRILFINPCDYGV